MAKPYYNVCVPRKYTDRAGVEKTHFWQVGKMWPMADRDGFNIELYTRVLPTDKLVMFPATPPQDRAPRPANAPESEFPEDDIPF